MLENKIFRIVKKLNTISKDSGVVVCGPQNCC